MKNIIIIAAVLLSFATYNRNLIWLDDVSLWQDASAKSYKWRTFSNLGDSWSKNGFTDNAVAAYNKALEIDPECAPVHYSLGKIYQSIGPTELALQEFKISLKYADNYLLQTDDPVIIKTTIHHRLGLVYYDMNLTDDAEKEFREVLNLSPSYSDAYYNLGVIYMDRGQLDRAIGELERAVGLTGGPDKLVRTRNLLGTAYARKGSIEEGIGNFREVLKIDPANAEARENLKAAVQLLR